MQTETQPAVAPPVTAPSSGAGAGGSGEDAGSTAVRLFVYGCTAAYHVTLRLANVVYKLAIYFWPLTVWMLRKYIWWYFGRYINKTSTALAWIWWATRKGYRYASSRGRAPPPPKPTTAPETPPPPPPEMPKLD